MKTKTDTDKKIHIQIKGTGKAERKEITEAAADMVFELGLSGYTAESESTVEIVAQGEKRKLWDLIKSFTQSKIGGNAKEIRFYFKEVEVESTSSTLSELRFV